MTQQKKLTIWLVWLIVWPTLLFYLYNVLEPSIDGKWFDVISFAILMCIVAFFPIIVGETPIFFIQGISFAVFLYFGLFVEIVLTQIAVIVLMLKLRTGKEDLHRVPVNLTMFLLISIMGAAIFYLLGGTNGEIETFSFEQVLPIISYALAIIVANQILLHLLRMFMTGKTENFFSRSLLWDVITSIVTLPVGFVLYLLYIELGAKAIYFVGIPFIIISVVIMNYYATNKINHYLQKTSEIGHKLTGQLNVKEVLDIFVNEISELLEVDYTYIFDVTNSTETLTLIRFVDADNETPLESVTLKKFDGISGTVYGEGEGVYYSNRIKWEKKVQDSTLTDDAESVISVPIRRNEKIVGIITIVSKNKRTYEKYHYMLVEILANYLAVAIENARHYDSTKRKSERCPLTKLYNLRYLETYLATVFEDMKAKGVQENHSMILLDLDHFKKVNDSYGHESGNEVLRELARRLEEFVGDGNVVARYGGEEFVIFLKDKSKGEAQFEAEKLRRVISDKPFTLTQHIMQTSDPIEVKITASIGVASFPDDCEEPSELIRHADRAMYVGAKRRGRNRVATYEKVSEA
ncbi:diguanylate cyclase (GGDEF)-like protein [Salirhabdus euzebyi]|uniref:Diguanylate cyclase (GGDEF)-like protein n=1 Tax=Salirhabdus euzebyi TaxID=394506 RepID=A0A841Q1V2_9BACI|nr:sensor domain-containing diguanylate cyclase [Salirhabdus euzebyi]MBB6451925.1 diguanylate cyclase (GGDEF)-like protein [Salirhabdus euzebyi]